MTPSSFGTKSPSSASKVPPPQFAFTADGELFRLAYLFDPMQAVFTSAIEPLPHQIRAVYEDMLVRQPLCYLLADDPGAGKTIMAGILIKGHRGRRRHGRPRWAHGARYQGLG